MAFLKAIIGSMTLIRRSTKTGIWVGLILIWCSMGRLHSQSLNEYQVKAVFIYNFVHFIQWPSSVMTTPEAPFVIGVLGKNVFGSFLEQAVSGEKLNGHPIIVKYLTSSKEAEACHILFISKSHHASSDEIATIQKHKHILTVSDAETFTKQWGMIRFFTENNKIRIEVNTKAVEESDLEISAKLLRLATII
jgi:hypothetical protein